MSETKVTGSLESRTMGVDDEGLGQMSVMLRDDIYVHKALAVVREIVCNAVDEHISKGVERKVKVHVPSIGEPWFSVRDYAAGLSKEDVFGIFFQYFKSTKREDRKTAGQFGIGAKAPFCFSDTMVVTSWHGGEKSVYVGVIVDQKSVAHLDSVELSEEETGIEVRIDFDFRKSIDISSAFNSFYEFYKSYRELETINYDHCGLDDEKVKRIVDGYLVSAELGYLSHYSDKILFKGVLYECPWKVNPNGGHVILAIDDSAKLDLHPSRERIQSSERNMAVVGEYFERAWEKTIEHANKMVPESGFYERWAARVEHALFFKELKSLGMPFWPAESTEDICMKEYRAYAIEENGSYSKIYTDSAGYTRLKLSLDEPTRVCAISKCLLRDNLAAALVKKFPEEKILVVASKRSLGDYSFNDIKTAFGGKFVEIFEDETNLEPEKKERKKREKIAGKVYCFKRCRYIDAQSIPENSMIVPLYHGRANLKGFEEYQIKRACDIAKVNVVGVNKKQEKALGAKVSKFHPVIKAMRRNAHKVSDAQKTLVKTVRQFEDAFEFLGLMAKEETKWPFRPKKKVFPSKKIVDNNRKVEKINSLIKSDPIFYALSKTMDSYASSMRPEIAKEIKERLEK